MIEHINDLCNILKKTNPLLIVLIYLTAIGIIDLSPFVMDMFIAETNILEYMDVQLKCTNDNHGIIMALEIEFEMAINWQSVIVANKTKLKMVIERVALFLYLRQLL